MRAQLVRVLLGVVGATFLAIPVPAQAEHGSVDEASSNMLHVAQRERGGVNSDLAFWQGGNVNGRAQDLAAAGNYSGFRLLNISNPENPKTVSTVMCRGPQGDVSFYKARNRLLVFVSVDTPQTTPGPAPGQKDCASADSTTTTGGWEGIRIWDVTNAAAPKFVTAVQTDCGSHTHTTIPDYDERRALIYVSSYPLAPTGIGVTPPLPPFGGGNNQECGTVNPANGKPHGKISIVEVPDANPAAAQVISEPPLHLDTPVSTGELGSLPGSTGCHDISVITEANQAPEANPKPRFEIAAAACLTQGQLWDISDPANPKTLDPEGHSHIQNESVEIWHSASFTWDGEVVLFGDEHGGGSAPGCGGEEDTTGNVWFYRNVEPPAPVPLLGRYHVPRQQLAPPQECSMHNFNVVPINDNRAYIGVSSAYRAGTTVFDFSGAKTAPEHTGSAFDAPLLGDEVGWYDAKVGGEADTWSTYWFNDYIYANDGLGNRGAGNRGFDVFKILLDPQDTTVEDPTRQLRGRKLQHLNPQTQEVFTVQGG